jgi:hypothetical protein
VDDEQQQRRQQRDAEHERERREELARDVFARASAASTVDLQRVGPPVVGNRARGADDQQEDEQPLLVEEAAKELRARGQERGLLEVGAR